MTEILKQPLPPPPPPPPTKGEPTKQQPTFIEQWLKEEKEKSPKAKTRQYYYEQCMFPRHVPSKAMPDVDPTLSLIFHHGEEQTTSNSDGAKDVGGSMSPTHRTALDDFRKVVSLCATYKDRSIANHKEFRYKRAIKLKEKQMREEQNMIDATTADDAAESNTTLSNKTTATADVPAKQAKQQSAPPTPPRPPDHSEYTPLPIGGNHYLSKIHEVNYNLCLANAACPERTKRLTRCWKRVDPRTMKAMEEQGMESFVCSEEREAVERCVGLSVQRVMKDILG